ncbi:hypothetical protein [Alishewanella longhuensis]
MQQLQQHFLTLLAEQQHPLLHKANLLLHNASHHGHFYMSRLDSSAQVAELAAFLSSMGNIARYYRGDRLRFGFALYQNAESFNLSCLKSI